MEPAEFYTGIVADLYAPLKSATNDPRPYADFVRESGEPALELGCGDGEPLLDLRRQGLDVDGVDSSADMLDRCRRNAAATGIDVVVHHQRMEALDVPRRYRSIFLAGPTFTLLPDDDTALRALRGIRDHLTEDGSALIPLFVPSPTPAADLGRVRERREPDGTLLRFAVLSEDRDEPARTVRMLLRYERHTAEDTAVVERPWILHWHTEAGFRDLSAAAGLTTVAVRTPGADEFAVVLRPA